MSIVKHFVSESLKKAEINEFLRNEFEKAGYGGVDIAKTPLGTHIVVYAMRPGLVIGRGGETIKELAKTAEILAKPIILTRTPQPTLTIIDQNTQYQHKP